MQGKAGSTVGGGRIQREGRNNQRDHTPEELGLGFWRERGDPQPESGGKLPLL